MAGDPRVRWHGAALPGAALRGLPQARLVAAARRGGGVDEPGAAYNLPGKGSLVVGSDADLTVVDLEKTQTVTAELCQSGQDHCPFEGVELTGWPDPHGGRRPGGLPQQPGRRHPQRPVHLPHHLTTPTPTSRATRRPYARNTDRDTRLFAREVAPPGCLWTTAADVRVSVPPCRHGTVPARTRPSPRRRFHPPPSGSGGIPARGGPPAGRGWSVGARPTRGDG